MNMEHLRAWVLAKKRSADEEFEGGDEEALHFLGERGVGYYQGQKDMSEELIRLLDNPCQHPNVEEFDQSGKHFKRCVDCEEVWWR
jgi:hypothetical protein